MSSKSAVNHLNSKLNQLSAVCELEASFGEEGRGNQHPAVGGRRQPLSDDFHLHNKFLPFTDYISVLLAI